MIPGPAVTHLSMLGGALVLASCWSQEDTISIDKDGTVTFSSSVVIEDKAKEFALSDIDELSAEFMNELRSAGWKIERVWVSQTRPYRMSFSGGGNLKRVGQAPDFYRLTRVSDTEFQVSFIPAEREGRKSSRRIVFRQRLLASDASVRDGSGQQVSKIENVDEREVYTVKLQ